VKSLVRSLYVAQISDPPPENVTLARQMFEIARPSALGIAATASSKSANSTGTESPAA
jgi:hypothetical protein